MAQRKVGACCWPVTMNPTYRPSARRPLGAQETSRKGRPFDCENLSNFTSTIRIAALMEKKREY